MKTRIIALSILAVATIFVIAQSLPISRFPNVGTPLDSDLFVLAQTQAPATNKNIRYDQLRGAIRSGLATEAYVLSTSNSLSAHTPSVIAGAGNGNTNYTLQVTSPKMLLGSSNVNIVAVMQTIAGKTHNWSVNITNLSANTWGISFSSVTNRWKFQSYMYGTSAPTVLTNNTLLKIDGESQGSNTLIQYQYFSPAL